MLEVDGCIARATSVAHFSTGRKENALVECPPDGRLGLMQSAYGRHVTFPRELGDEFHHLLGLGAVQSGSTASRGMRRGVNKPRARKIEMEKTNAEGCDSSFLNSRLVGEEDPRLGDQFQGHR